MTTYQDIVDYMNKNYAGDHAITNHDGYYTINTSNDDNHYISIEDYYYTIVGSLIIGKGLNKLLADLLDTPVDQRNKPKIKHTIKPVSKENLELHDAPILDTNDKIINRINSFILSDWSADHNRTLILVSSFINRGLEEVFKLFKDFNFTIEDSHDYIDGFGAPCGWVYILSIKAK